MSFSHHDNIITHTRGFANWSGDRLKENEIFIESVCETLSKLRLQLYDKKPDMENDDPTTWYKESGLIAQEIYYDAPELRYLINRTNNEIDEEGNSIPLLEIPTSIDPQQDPGYSYWDFQNGSHAQAWSNISVKGSSFMSFSHHDNIRIHTRNFANWSGDRLKENEIFIESACET